MPQGKRKGGTRFPRHSLEDCVGWAKKLVSKTHLAPQPAAVVLAGVIGSTSSVGQIKLSSIKQYGFLDGTSSGYFATDLAKKINSSVPEELPRLLKLAALNAVVFKALFDTFHGDAVPRARLRQRVSDLKVHPDEAEFCVEIYVLSMQFAGIVSVEGDKIVHSSSIDVSDVKEAEKGGVEVHASSPSESGGEREVEDQVDGHEMAGNSGQRRAVFNVNVTLDSSLDIEKLSKQLELLKKFGAI